MSTFLHEDLALIFKKIYAIRSKFLHTGSYSTTNNYTAIKPIIDTKTGTCLIDTGGIITFQIQGSINGVSVQNIQEWVSFALRNYYREKLIGNFSK